MTTAPSAARKGDGGSDASAFPDHIAIIMDGNGRWAKSRGMPRAMGHERGVEGFDIGQLAIEIGLNRFRVHLLVGGHHDEHGEK